MICPKCGNTVPENALFCNRCGLKITSQTMQTPVPAAQNNEQQAKTETSPQLSKDIKTTQKLKYSFDISVYSVYLKLSVFIHTLVGGAVGFGIGILYDGIKRITGSDLLFCIIFALIGLVVGYLLGKVSVMIPRLLLIIAKNSEIMCGKIDINDESVKKLLSLKDKGVISEDEFIQLVKH